MTFILFHNFTRFTYNIVLLLILNSQYTMFEMICYDPLCYMLIYLKQK